MEHVRMPVWPVPIGVLAGVGAQHVVEHRQILVPQRLGSLGEFADSTRVRSNFGLGENCA